MIFRNSCPVRGLKMKMAPLMGFVVRFPSNVCRREGGGGGGGGGGSEGGVVRGG